MPAKLAELWSLGTLCDRCGDDCDVLDRPPDVRNEGTG